VGLIDIVVLIVGLGVILVGSELFTNGIEWFGHKVNLAEGAVGSVLAAVGTALPETMIPIVAIAFSGSAAAAGRDVGVGAILGAPFMLGTLAMFVTGVAVMTQARRRSTGDLVLVDLPNVRKDVGYFFVAYTLALLAAFLPSDAGLARIAMAVVLLSIYAWYVRGHFIADPDVDAADLAPLHLHRLDPGRRAQPHSPRLRIVNFQVVLAVALILGGAVVFVDAMQDLAGSFGVPPAVLALILAPIATELPEKFNSVIWVRQGKDTLALGNITGAMVFQSCIPTVVGLVFAAQAWKVDFSSTESVLAFASAGIAFASMAAIFLPTLRRGRLTSRALLVGGGFYAVYVVVALVFIAGLI
jgi:cation:H+ antiporter